MLANQGQNRFWIGRPIASRESAEELDHQTLDLLDKFLDDITHDGALPPKVAPSFEPPFSLALSTSPVASPQPLFFQPLPFQERVIPVNYSFPVAVVPSRLMVVCEPPPLNLHPIPRVAIPIEPPIVRALPPELPPDRFRAKRHPILYDDIEHPLVQRLHKSSTSSPSARPCKRPRVYPHQHIEEMKQEVVDLLVRQMSLREAQNRPRQPLDLNECVTVLTKLMRLRFAAVTDLKLWNALVAPAFELHLPAGMLPGLDELSGPPTGTLRKDGLRVLEGLNQVIQDVAHLKKFLQSILIAFQVEIPGQPTPESNGFHLLPVLNPDEAILLDNVVMCSWSLTVETLAECSFVAIDGMLECTFAADGRVKRLVLFYDILSLAGRMQEFRQAKLKMQQLAESAAAKSSRRTVVDDSTAEDSCI